MYWLDILGESFAIHSGSHCTASMSGTHSWQDQLKSLLRELEKDWIGGGVDDRERPLFLRFLRCYVCMYV